MPTGNVLRRGQALIVISALEYVIPFFRVLLLSRFLDLREIGFCSALLATSGLLEQMTELGLYRFVMTTPREERMEALACVQAMSLLRGLMVGAIAVLIGPIVAGIFSLGADWRSFSFLGAVIFAKSFENFAPRVAERDFYFGAQLKVGLVANGLSFLILVVMLLVVHDHRALLASLFAWTTSYAIASHYYSDTPYRISFRSPLMTKALRFGFPLTINGAAMALAGQADRFVVGSLLGLKLLGVYSIVSSAVVLPTNMMARIMAGVNTALYYKAMNSEMDKGRIIAASSSFSAIVAAAYATCVALLLNLAVNLVFGARFHVSDGAVVILSLFAYVRIARAEPFNSMLLLEGRTRRLALVNLAVAAGLLVSFILVFNFRSQESAFAARLASEAAGAASAIYLTRKLLQGGYSQMASAYLIGLAIVGSAGFITYSGWAASSWSRSFASLSAFAVFIGVWAWTTAGPPIRKYIIERQAGRS